jgi:uncharacterized protein GlcG (DUF336 family)
MQSVVALAIGGLVVLAGTAGSVLASCQDLPNFTALRTALRGVVNPGGNGGLGNDMWGTLVDRDGIVCAVAFTGPDGSAWPGSRVIAAQKANTANAFSRPGVGGHGTRIPLSTANLYTAVQPGGTLYGLQHSNPVDPAVAYGGDPAKYGLVDDPMVGQRIGGINVFGGGLALYTPDGVLVGGLGVSGDTSCTDHIVAWKVRHALNLDNVPGGVSATGDDNIIFSAAQGSLQAAFIHPECDPVGAPATGKAEKLPTTYPVGPNP